MYTVYYGKRFRKSLKRLEGSGDKQRVAELKTVLWMLSAGEILPEKYQDHPLHHEYEGYRECHIRPDFLLVYALKHKELILVVFDFGSHAHLFD